MVIDVFQVDAFAGRVFEGNPAAICPLKEWLPDETMQQIAAENNLSETAFFVEQPDGYDLRWFTPRAEMDLCGHATLASAHVLFTHLGYPKNSISFFTRSGELTVERKENSWYAMNFPVPTLRTEQIPEPLKQAMDQFEILECFKADDYLLVAENEAEIRNASPDMRLLSETDARGVIITAPGDSVDFVSRFFAPQVGVPEDPVTGSAHTMLVPYWAKRLKKRELTARQVSDRGGNLKCVLLDDDRVEISGQACTYLHGKIELELAKST